MRQRDTQLPRVPRDSKASKRGIVRFFCGETSFRLSQTISAAARMNPGKEALLALPFATQEVTDVMSAKHQTSGENMYTAPTWNLDASCILTRHELATVLADLKAKAGRLTNATRNLVIFRLACCCGLRVSEIAGLQLDDVVLATPRPHLRLRAATTKGHRTRRVPLWWDAGTLADVTAWAATRREHGARGADPFVCSVQA